MEKNLIHDVELSRVEPDPDQPRKHFDEDDLRELGLSIMNDGQRTPIVVTGHPSDPEKLLLVQGERRCRAAKMVGLTTIKAVFEEYASAADRFIAQGLENMARANMRPTEEIAVYDRLLREFQMPVEHVAKRFGKSEAVILADAKLAVMPVEMQKALDAGTLPKKVAREIVDACTGAGSYLNILTAFKHALKGGNVGEMLANFEAYRNQKAQVDLFAATEERLAVDKSDAAKARKMSKKLEDVISQYAKSKWANGRSIDVIHARGRNDLDKLKTTAKVMRKLSDKLLEDLRTFEAMPQVQHKAEAAAE